VQQALHQAVVGPHPRIRVGPHALAAAREPSAGDAVRRGGAAGSHDQTLSLTESDTDTETQARPQARERISHVRRDFRMCGEGPVHRL
jgi:hypothetical protein